MKITQITEQMFERFFYDSYTAKTVNILSSKDSAVNEDNNV